MMGFENKVWYSCSVESLVLHYSKMSNAFSLVSFSFLILLLQTVLCLFFLLSLLPLNICITFLNIPILVCEYLRNLKASHSPKSLDAIDCPPLLIDFIFLMFYGNYLILKNFVGRQKSMFLLRKTKQTNKHTNYNPV